ncbi:DUF4179 domain-containing protein [Metabacillus sp. GX 13764]|uniref:DUF4179 domain-containing protein n=1 Tax=Metabacillus kandeliae TaxID=2900151 RepID=UPI001E5FFC7F|nr:DUF4179 domain-containing protein [Metabacillus kandeliae]MCD7033252.1 DUF4179 domain-containing protein [Metabacillus kandeliae]
MMSMIAAAAILFLLLMQSPLKDEIEGAFTKKSSSLFSQSFDPGLAAMSSQNDVSQVNQSSENSGIKVTLKEVMYDGYRLAISYKVQSKEKFVGRLDSPRLKVNGKLVKFSFDPSRVGEFKEINSQEKVHSYKGIASFVINDKIPSDFKATIQFFSIRSKSGFVLPNKPEDSTNGKWEFTVPVKKRGEVYAFKPEDKVKDGVTTLSVDQIILAPSATEIRFSKEDKGRRLPLVEAMAYRVLDDKGNLLAGFGDNQGSGEEKNGNFILHSKRTYGPPSGKPSYLVIQPFLYDGPTQNANKNHTTIKSISDKLPMTFPQKNGSIVVNKIEESNDKKHVKVYYEVKGDLPEIRGSALYLLKGKTIKKGGTNVLNDNHYFENIKSADRNKMAEFNTGLQKDLYLAGSYASPVLFKDLELKIPIKREDLLKK